MAIDGLNGVIGEYKGGATSACAQPYTLAPGAVSPFALSNAQDLQLGF